MKFLNSNSSSLRLEGFEKSEKKILLSDAVESLEGEKFKIIKNFLFPVSRFVQQTDALRIPTGMYQHAKEFFSQFADIKLKELPDSRVQLNVPTDVKVRFNEKLMDMLGFIESTFTSGTYISKYALDLSAGINEVFLYTDIIYPQLLGNTSAQILKIIPIANERDDQIVKHFPVPLYFPVKKNNFDSIEMELRTSSGSLMQFISGKTSLVLSFRKKKV